MPTTTVIYLYSTVVLLAPLMLVMVEKAIYEATSVILNTKHYFSVIFNESE